MLLSSANGIRYGVSTPPPILEPSDTTVPFIRATDIKNGEILTENLLHIDIHQSERMQKCLLEAGEMILVRSGVNTGDCAIVPDALAGSYAAYDLILNLTNVVVPLFVSTFLDTEVGRIQLNVLKDRSAQPHLNAEEVSSVLVPKPPLEIQRSLVAEIEAARQTRKQKLAQADELLSSLDTYLLAQLGLSAPEESDKKVFAVKLGKIKRGRLDPKFALSKEQEAGTFHTTELGNLVTSEPEYGSGARAVPLRSPEDIKYIRITDFDDNGIPPEHEFVSAEVVDSEYSLEHEDILFARSGATAGKTFIYTRDIGLAIFAGYCIRFRFNQSLVLPWFVYFYTKTSIYKAWVNSIQRPSGQPNINKEEFKSFKIAIPPVDVQGTLIIEMQHRRSEAQQLRQEAETEWEAAKTRFEHKLLGEEV